MDIDFYWINTFIALITVIVLTVTIQNNKKLNEINVFNEIIKQERELRVKLNEYRKDIDNCNKPEQEINIKLDHDTLLFNFYEYLAICIKKKLIKETNAKIYFKILIKNLKKHFKNSQLFKTEVVTKRQYPGILWLFKYWKIQNSY